MRSYFKPTNMVLLLLCLMYFITYMDRLNISTAGSAIQKEMGFNNTELGLIFSAFAYPYLVFQIVGGWVGDRFGPRRTLFACGAIWAVATILTGFAGGFISLFLARVLLGFGEGATFPTATRAMQYWIAPGKRGFAQGLTHAFSRLGNSATPIVVAALMAATSWRGAFYLLGSVSFVWVIVWYWYFRDDPKDHPGITAEELATLPPRQLGAQPPVPFAPLLRRIWPVTLTYFCYGWCLWLYLSWLPLFFKNNYSLDIQKSAIYSSGVFLAGVIGDTLGGMISDHVLRRTGNVRLARLSIICLGFGGAFLSLFPMIYTHDLTSVALCLSGGFFFAELVIGPIWSIPMDIAPKFSGTAAGMMNTGSAFAGIVSPIVAGYVIDVTGNWILPFIMTLALLALGGICAFAMHPEIPFDEEHARGRAESAPAVVR
ncbi:Sugar phosphate permease [Rhizobiales bacterium GAS191]|nr:Sugar phosphate permease [Rhizobiales bacterium GAS191]